ncbi:hypothetical protein LLG10_05195 [bacterium]|nr:hypothetical protein [bacterium]
MSIQEVSESLKDALIGTCELISCLLQEMLGNDPATGQHDTQLEDCSMVIPKWNYGVCNPSYGCDPNAIYTTKYENERRNNFVKKAGDFFGSGGTLFP